MNCPHHIRIFASAPHSYRDLPVRLAEFGTVYRWEQSGEIGGMTRVRGFTQDDAHLFCREDQVAEEVLGCLSIVKLIFGTLGMHEYRVRVGLRDPDSAKYVGDPANWDKAEEACRKRRPNPRRALHRGARRGGVLRPEDRLRRQGRHRPRAGSSAPCRSTTTCPIRFDLSYVGADNQPHRPVMIHRAPFGSMERFVGCLIEHFAGAFPLWLSPEQVRVLPISEKSLDYAKELHAALRAAGLRTTLDDSNDRIQGKIKVASDLKIPYCAVVGPRDAENRKVSVRAFGIEANLGEIGFDAFVEGLAAEHRSRGAESVRAAMAKG